MRTNGGWPLLPAGGLALCLAIAACVEDEGGLAQVSPQAHSPGPRYGHEMVHDEGRRTTLLFGGFGPDGVPKGDTWSWDGASWRLVAATGPSPRKWPAMAYDARRGVVVLHGGREGVGRSGASLADTWTWDGESWHRSGATGPPGRDHHRAVYDRKRDRVVLFGGWDGSSVVGDTWEWDGTGWHRAATTGPAARAPLGLAYHGAREQVVLMGGKDLATTYADTWLWDGSRWTKLDVEGPLARSFHAMVYDSEGERVLVFGGRDGDHLHQDLWSWDGDAWLRIGAAGPLRRGIHASAWDRSRSRLVIHGSGDRVDGQWVLESTTWTWNDATGWLEVELP